MSALIYDVERGSLAWRHGIRPGWEILTINGEPVYDILEYRFFCAEDVVRLELLTDKGKKKKVKIHSRYEDLGISFENPLIDHAKSCHNKCVFCFIDQLPPGMRETLYFKDDDSRLSFLHGNYVTLTNMNMSDLERVVKARISPLNISVQATDPQLRCKLLHNRFAGDLMDKMRYLAEHEITMNCQIVCCPGLNDGEELYDIGWEDYLARGGVCAVAWSERMEELPEGCVTVSIRRGENDGQRKITITGGGFDHEDIGA